MLLHHQRYIFLLKSAAAPIIIINAKAFVTVKFIHRILIIDKQN